MSKHKHTVIHVQVCIHMCTPTHTYRYVSLRGLIPGGASGCQVPQLITAWSCSVGLPLIRPIAAYLWLGMVSKHFERLR